MEYVRQYHKSVAWLMVLIVVIGFASLAPARAQSAAGSCGGAIPVEPGMNEVTLESGGQTRSFLLHVPESYDGTSPAPVVLSMHGFSSNPDQQREFSRWDELGESEGFLTVYPRGTGFPLRWNAGLFSDPGVGVLGALLGEQADDLGFFNDLLDYLESNYCIDAQRVYATGLSNGGGMSNRLACEMADRIAAIGTVAGAYPELEEGCNPSRVVPVISFHGVVDPIVPYEGAEDMGLPDINEWIQDWAARATCTEAESTTGGTPDAVTVTTYTACQDDAEVVLYSIPDGGHTWPGGLELPEFLVGKTRQDIDATAIMWEFVKRFAIES
ncbi:MAG: poly(3-hydroxybutyrate) depolymerase [Chloroflexi bacterium]|nr:poly(3-hydroxybutyrate) depolymerase [Chloroflexota bacterium]